MKRIKSIWLLSIILFVISCSRHLTPNVPIPKSATVKTFESYEVIISFFSIGEGIDRKSLEGFHNYVSSFNQSEKSKIVFDEVHWGREGEVDFCFNLLELNKGQQTKFIFGLKELMKNNKLVHIEENKPCIHKR